MSEFEHQSDLMNNPPKGIGDAAWAQNRWPALGLYAGAGIGLILGVVSLAGWWTILFVIGIAIAGCLSGLLAASLMYRQLILPGRDPHAGHHGAMVGVFAGAGTGLLLGITLDVRWATTILLIAGCGMVTGLIGYVTMRLLFSGDRDTPRR